MVHTRDIRLFILMRADLDSLNPGKAMAQAAHAGNMLSEAARALPKDSPEYKMYQAWLGDRGFGTTIVLETQASYADSDPNAQEQMENLLDELGKPYLSDACVLSGMVHDPTYPIRDGEVTHLIPLDTCAWYLCDADDEELAKLRENFRLHR